MTSSFSQSGLLDDGNVWYNAKSTYDHNSGFRIRSEYHINSIIGDTILYGKDYRILDNGQFEYYLREDTNLKVFAMVYLEDSLREFLLYDFGIDSVGYIDHPWKQMGLDSNGFTDSITILKDRNNQYEYVHGEKRKTWTAMTNGGYAYIIFGVGSNRDLLDAYDPYKFFSVLSWDEELDLLCFRSVDSTTKYSFANHGGYEKEKNFCNEFLSDKVVKEEERFEMYPNPFSTSVFVNIQGQSESDKQLSVYDLNGREVLRELIPTGKSNYEFGGDLLPGMYLVKVISEGREIYTQKIIKQ